MVDPTASVSTPQSLRQHLRRIARRGPALWGVRIVVGAALIVGMAGTLAHSRYSASQWLDLVLFGITVGSIYAQVALGYTMVYGVLRLINFAHGDITMAGAFAGYFVASAIATDRHPALVIALTLAVSVVVAVGVALLVERVAYRPFRQVRGFAPLICAIGASLFLEQTMRGLFGSSVKSYPDLQWRDALVDVAGVRFPVIDAVVIACTVASMALLYLVVHRTRLGTAMRAVSEDAEAATLMGIDVDRVVVFTFALGGAMAGIAGVFYAFVFKQVYFYMGFTLGIKAFAAAVLGGIGSVPGAMIGGLVLGVFESVGPALFFDGMGISAPYQLRDVIGFALLIAVLVFRPSGLLGARSTRPGA